MNIFSIKCYFRASLKIDATKNGIFWGISWIKLKSEIHSPGNFLLFSTLSTKRCALSALVLSVFALSRKAG